MAGITVSAFRLVPEFAQEHGRVLAHTDLPSGFENLEAYRKRNEERAAFQTAPGDELAVFERHAPETASPAR